MTKVIIIGAGIGALATANLLAASGYEVDVYEKQSEPGGRAGKMQVDGFTFDTGPSWYLMPEVFEQYYDLLGEDIKSHLNLTRLDPAYQVYFEGQTDPVVIHADLDKDRHTFEAIEPGAGDKLAAYLARSSQTYQLAMDHFLYTNFEKKTAFIHPAIVRVLPRLASALSQPIDSYVGRYFRDERLKQIMEYPMVFLGTSPFEAPALYSLMSHMDFSQGVYYPRGGIYTIIESLVTIGTKHGVNYHYNAAVQAINTSDGRATGITLADGRTFFADIIVSGADLHFTETGLLAAEDRSYDEPYWRRKQAGPSALLMYLGVRGSLPQLEHHNLLFAADWKANFENIFKHKQWPDPASIYICKASHTDAGIAPPGHENVFVLVPAPAGLPTSPDELEDLADTYLAQISAMTGIDDLSERIVTRRLLGPEYFSQQFNSWQGTALGLSHRLSQSALFRPSNKSRKLSNLYYVGGSTMPGIGLPMCLISAQLVYKRLYADMSVTALQALKRQPHV